MPADIVSFLRARLDRLEAAALAEVEYQRRLSQDLVGASLVFPPLMEIGWADPDFVLAEVEAKRAILDRYDFVRSNGPARDNDRAMDMTVGGLWRLLDVLRMLAQPYADHPDFDPSWTEETRS